MLLLLAILMQLIGGENCYLVNVAGSRYLWSHQ